MGAIETRTFQTADGVAVRLPEALGIAPGTVVTVEQIGDQIRIKPVNGNAGEAEATTRDELDLVEDKRKLSEMIARLRAIGPITPVGEREGIEFPDRPGLY